MVNLTSRIPVLWKTFNKTNYKDKLLFPFTKLEQRFKRGITKQHSSYTTIAAAGIWTAASEIKPVVLNTLKIKTN